MRARPEPDAGRGAPRRRVVVMARLPVLGAVKTRLARDVGAVAATRFYRHTCAALLRRLTADPRWETLLAVAPDTAVGARGLPSACRRMPQGRGDLGRRMQRILDRSPRGPVLIIGSDIPGVRPAHLWAAFRSLGRCDVVLGPACDGGYWLAGARRTPRVPRPFAGVRWSSPHALADTQANLGEAAVAFVDRLRDVDDGADYAETAAIRGRTVIPSP